MSRTTIEEAEHLARKHEVVLLGGRLQTLQNLAALIDEVRGQEVAEVRWASICGTNPPFISVSSLIPLDELYDGMKLYAKLKEKP